MAPKLKKNDGKMDWSMPAATIHNRVRGFNPWPGSFCVLPADGGKVLKVLATRVESGKAMAPGTLLETTGEGPLVQAGDQAIRLLEVQPEGRKPMTGAAFLRGYSLASGDVMG